MSILRLFLFFHSSIFCHSICLKANLWDNFAFYSNLHNFSHLLLHFFLFFFYYLVILLSILFLFLPFLPFVFFLSSTCLYFSSLLLHFYFYFYYLFIFWLHVSCASLLTVEVAYHRLLWSSFQKNLPSQDHNYILASS